MRSLLLRWGVIVVLFGWVAPALAQDDEDKVIRGKRASEWLAVLRSDKEALNRQRALIAVELAGPQTRKVFEEVGSAMRLDSDDAVRLRAAQVLGRLGAKATDPDRPDKIPVKAGVDALVAALPREKSPAIREAIAIALSRMGPEAKEGVSTLAGALKDPAPEVRTASAEALFRLAAHAKDAVKPLTEAIATSKTPELWRTRLAASTTINRIGRPDAVSAVPALIAALRETEPASLNPEERRLLTEVRRQMVETLGTLGDVAAADILTTILDRALDTRDAQMGRTSLTALTKLAGDRKGLVPVLVRAMAPPPEKLQDHFIRAEAIHHLGQLGKDLGEHRKTVVQNLRRSLTDRLADVRLAAIHALGELGPEVIGDETRAVAGELRVLTRSGDKAIAEAADAALRRLEK